MAEVTLGGERLGSGNKMKQYLHNYERSSHDIGYIWRSTMAAGTLVPFMSELALPGDTFDIDLDCDVLTHPTIAPLFGSYKVQLDVFQVPIRLYQPLLHMNKIGIGLHMNEVPLPQILVNAPVLDDTKPIDNQQINPSSIFAYLGIRGCGNPGATADARYFNAVPYLAYWDIFKCYYANKQEEMAYVIHKTLNEGNAVITKLEIFAGTMFEIPDTVDDAQDILIQQSSYCIITFSTMDEGFQPDQIELQGSPDITLADIFSYWTVDTVNLRIIGSQPWDNQIIEVTHYEYSATPAEEVLNAEPVLVPFQLQNIDDERTNILQSVVPYELNVDSQDPYGLPLQHETVDSIERYSQLFAQEGLAVKTYQSDIFNNWISTEWLDGSNGINELTAIDTSGGSFTINELMLSRKIYDVMMRIAVSGGTYDDWLDAVYTHERQRSAENPMYIGGLIKNLVFQEVVSNSASVDEQGNKQPLGTLAGRGRLGQKHKGGHIVAKVDEPSYIMAIVSLTPLIDYSQGNRWDMNLKTIDDLHKPGLDQIGFQDLITDQMAWWDSTVVENTVTTKSAGKQPAWINYMTNHNRVLGNFADETQQGYMVLNRNYEVQWDTGATTIRDLTTYIDPSKFNHIFADTRRDAQNFWTQIAVNITARRKMSAKQIPNL